MGFGRNIGQSAVGIALLVAGASAGAAPAEPLIITRLHDPTLISLSDGAPDPSSEQSLDEAAKRVSRALSEALQSDQQAIDHACRSRSDASGGSQNHWGWQAACIYRRH